MKKRSVVVSSALNAHHAMLVIALVSMAVFIFGGYPWAAAYLPFCMWSTFALAAWCMVAVPFADSDDRGSLWASCAGILLPACMYLSAYLHLSDELARWM